MDPNTPATPPPPFPLSPPPQPPPVMPAALMQPMIVERKSPGLAGFLSFFPGLGHLYLGLYQRAFAFAGAFCVLIFFNSHGRIAVLSGPATAFLWFFGIIDDVRPARPRPRHLPHPPQANRARERHRHAAAEQLRNGESENGKRETGDDAEKSSLVFRFPFPGSSAA